MPPVNTLIQPADQHPFNQDYTVDIPANGQPVYVNAPGIYFTASDSTTAYPFSISFDGAAFFKWNVGMSLPWPTGFKKIWFKATNNVATSLTFYAGNIVPVDSRLTIVRDPNHYQIFNFQVTQTLSKVFTTAKIPANGNIVFPGKGIGSPDYGALFSAGAAFDYRKSICITNNDPGSDLEIYTPIAGESQTSGSNPDGTFSLSSTAHCARAGTVFFRQAWLNETNEDLVIANETGSDINCRVMELFYPVSVSPSVT